MIKNPSYSINQAGNIYKCLKITALFHLIPFKTTYRPGKVVYTFNPSTKKAGAKAGRSLNSTQPGVQSWSQASQSCNVKSSLNPGEKTKGLNSGNTVGYSHHFTERTFMPLGSPKY